MNLKTLYEFVIVCNVILIFLFLFEEKKNYRSMLMWVVLFIIFPLGGYLIYLLIGRNVVLPFFYTRDNEINLTMYNKVTYFIDGKRLFDDVIDEIKKAKTSIHIESYIFRSDDLGKSIISLLVNKAKDGVKVRIVYDPNGNIFNDKDFFKPLIKAGGEVKKYYYGIYRFLNFNHRNHRKIIVIDGIKGYIGGFNIGEEYMSKHPVITPWRDTQIKIEGESVYYLQKTFLNDYYSAAKKLKYEDKNDLVKAKCLSYCPMEIVSFFPNGENQIIKQNYLKEIYKSKREIIIQTPYLVPDIGLLNALKFVLENGIKVKIMIPKIYDKRISYYTTLEYAKELFDVGASIYLYKGFIHAKALIVDDNFLSLGSSNFDIRSFFHNLEINAFIYDKKKIKEYVDIFYKDIGCSDIYDDAYERKYLKKYRIGRKVFKILSSLM